MTGGGPRVSELVGAPLRELIRRDRPNGAGRPLALGLAAVAALLALALGACGNQSGRTLARGSTLRVGYSFPFDSADLAGRLALQRYGQDQHIKVRSQQLVGAPATVSNLLHGGIDLASLRLSDAINAVGRGAKLRVILGSKMFPEYVFVARSGITGPAQLRGKRIAIQGPRSDVQAFAKLVLARAGLGLADAEVTTIPNSTARTAAFVRGRIDATGLRYHEYLRLLRKDPSIRVLARMRDFEPRRMTQAWVVTDSFARRNAKALQTMVTDMLTEYALMYTPAGRRLWLAAGSDVVRGDPPQMAAAVYAYYHRYGMWPLPGRPITSALYAQMLGQLVSTGQVAKPVLRNNPGRGSGSLGGGVESESPGGGAAGAPA
jgi:ABC-type nitrate/sulfonate/bicarbonate transport system substrate-binding protein